MLISCNRFHAYHLTVTKFNHVSSDTIMCYTNWKPISWCYYFGNSLMHIYIIAIYGVICKLPKYVCFSIEVYGCGGGVGKGWGGVEGWGGGWGWRWGWVRAVHQLSTDLLGYADNMSTLIPWGHYIIIQINIRWNTIIIARSINPFHILWGLSTTFAGILE